MYLIVEALLFHINFVYVPFQGQFFILTFWQCTYFGRAILFEKKHVLGN
jgi:hypothetical protein